MTGIVTLLGAAFALGEYKRALNVGTLANRVDIIRISITSHFPQIILQSRVYVKFNFVRQGFFFLKYFFFVE